MRLRFVHASAANRFMRDIFDGIAFEARCVGVDAEVVDDQFSSDSDVVHVMVPHEYFAVVPKEEWPSEAILSRSIALTVEHPGTPWFEISASQAKRCAAVLDINLDAQTELQRRGLAAQHFQIGYTQRWDQWGGTGSTRDIDILYMGSTDPRRDAMLSEAAQWWSDIRANLLVTTLAPKPDDSPDSVTSDGKYQLLARSRLLVNAHRLQSSCLEWIRVIEAMSNGAVVVSEHSSDVRPLVAGTHFVSARIESLGLIARGMLDQPDDIDRMRVAAYDFIREEMPMRPSVERLVDLACALVRRPRHVPTHQSIEEPPRPGPVMPGWPTMVTPVDVQGAALRRIEHRLRRLEESLLATQAGVAAVADREVVRTPAMSTVAPRVSVIIASYNHSAEILDALSSLAGCSGPTFEVLIQDDASTDGSIAVVSRFLSERPWLAASLWAGQVNRGPSSTRNRLLERARGEFVFVLDADNGVYPPVLQRLVDALDADPAASFAYAPIAVKRGNEFVGLVSSRPWMPQLLRQGNYIDAMAMTRTEVLREFGGWNLEMDGWEDFHLWVRLAEAGHHAAFVPQVLSWYRASAHSLSIQVSVDGVGMWSRIRAAAPNLMAT